MAETEIALEIHGHHLPGRTWCPADAPHGNVHVGIQVGREPAELVPGDTDAAQWSLTVRRRELADGAVDFRGPAVQGRRGARFVYLTWGDVDPDGGFHMFRRAKLMLDDLLAVPGAPTRIVAAVHLTDDRGGPRCARLAPPALQLRPA
ncbi:hypothetical protein GCM10022237_19170 [Nocardioides ginsengisoli]|uniref:DUF5990 family protein n=1 Tax=Nocardioides ginsengisoli TaxID=363868 RepID=A0ABW3W5W9_9ACTN